MVNNLKQYPVTNNSRETSSTLEFQVQTLKQKNGPISKIKLKYNFFSVDFRFGKN